MKQYNKTHCPDTITYKGETFTLDIAATNAHKAGERLPGKCHVLVNVLSKNLKGRTDLYGREYKPNVFIYSTNRHHNISQ